MRVWILTFEYSGVAKAGGLGEAVYGYASHLKNRGHDVHVVMPSHGARGEILANYGSFSLYQRDVDGVKVILVSNPVLDEPTIYADGLIEAKSALLSRAMGGVLNAVGSPDVIHANDWHAVPSALSLQCLTQGKSALIFHVHLYLGKWVGWDYLFRDCGLDPGCSLRGLNLGEAYARSGGVLELIAAQVADRVVTVSKSYLEETIRPTLGWAAGDRLTFVYNGTNWSLTQLLSEVEHYHGHNLVTLYGGTKLPRRTLRRYFLTKALGDATPERLDPAFSWASRRVEPFASDGPLVLATGRASWQKGFDQLLFASSILTEVIPNVKVIILLLSVRGEEGHLSWLLSEADRRPNVRVFVGHARNIYALAHLAADAFAVPSRWEPFGLTAIEAMAAGVPVASSWAGGLKETVVDLRNDSWNGTGYLVPPEQPMELARALASLLTITAREDLVEAGRLEAVESFGLPKPQISGEELRRRCIERASKFTWSKSAEKMEQVYEEAVRRASGW